MRFHALFFMERLTVVGEMVASKAKDPTWGFDGSNSTVGVFNRSSKRFLGDLLP